MKNKILNIIQILIIAFFISLSIGAIAQPPPPPGGASNNSTNKLNGGGAPIGGGLFILLGLGIVYGVGKHYYNTDEQTNK